MRVILDFVMIWLAAVLLFVFITSNKQKIVCLKLYLLKLDEFKEPQAVP